MTPVPASRVYWLWWLLPLFLLLALWEIAGQRDGELAFFFSYPTAVGRDLVVGVAEGSLLRDIGYTALPAVTGLLLAAVVGGSAGFALNGAPRFAVRVQPLVDFLGALPVFAVAPMTLVWFGLDLVPKIFLAFIACVFLFLQAAHRGGLSVPPRLLAHFEAHGFSEHETFLKLRLPYSLDWLLAAFKTAANLALLGVFIGEFIAAEHGLAREMLTAGALYNVKRVLAAAILFALVAVALMALSDLVNRRRALILRWASVPYRSRS